VFALALLILRVLTSIDTANRQIWDFYDSLVRETKVSGHRIKLIMMKSKRSACEIGKQSDHIDIDVDVGHPTLST